VGIAGWEAMKNYDLELLALMHLGANGVSKKTLLEASSIYEESEPKNERGRPPHVGIRGIVFYLYAREFLSSGKLISNPVLCKTAELIRLQVKQIYEADSGKQEVPDEFRNPVKISAVKTWRNKFENLRVNHYEDWKMWFDDIETLRQKLKS
jgi:hypothetical protein